MISEVLVDQDRYPLTAEAGAAYRQLFLLDQYACFPAFFRPAGLELLAAEADRLRRLSIRRELKMAGSGGTDRKMSTLGGHVIAQSSSLVPGLYHDPALLAFLSGVTGEPVLAVPDPVENHVLNVLHQPGDVHGGHVDTYAFAFNLCMEAPSEEGGGLLEYVPRSTRLEDLDGPGVRRAAHQPGDAYLIKTDEAVHRVAPLNRPGRRTIFNFAYANPATLELASYSSSVLYGSNDLP